MCRATKLNRLYNRKKQEWISSLNTSGKSPRWDEAAHRAIKSTCAIRQKFTTPLLAVCLALLAACGEEPSYKQKISSESAITCQSERMDKDIFQSDYTNPSLLRPELHKKYRSFFCHYLEDILRIGPCLSDSSVMFLAEFAHWPDMVELQHAVEQIYPDEQTKAMDAGFEQALNRWHHFFPDSVVPQVIYMNSGLNYSAFCTDSVWATGLDYYLGTDHPLLKKLPPDLFPEYLRDDMRPDYAVVNTIKDFAQREVNQAVPVSRTPDLLSLLIFHGKVMYLTDVLLPETADSTKMNWSASQTAWALEHEENTWKEIALRDVMFSTATNDNVRWFDYGPFTNAGSVPHDSPPQLGIWMGWSIVRQYMDSHRDMTVRDLLRLTDNQEILRHYKPQ